MEDALHIARDDEILADLAASLAEHPDIARIDVGSSGALKAVAARGGRQEEYEIVAECDDAAAGGAPMAREYGMPDAIEDHLDLCDAVLANLAASRHREAIRGLVIEDCEGGSALRFRYRALGRALRIRSAPR